MRITRNIKMDEIERNIEKENKGEKSNMKTEMNNKMTSMEEKKEDKEMMNTTTKRNEVTKEMRRGENKMKQPLDKSTIIFENLKTKTIYTKRIEQNSKEADSYFIEQSESAEIGDILFKNFRILDKGSEVKSKYKKIGYNNGNKLYKDKINYGVLYIPDNIKKEGSTTQKIIFGLKCDPSDKYHSAEYEDNFAKKLRWILRSNKQIDMLCCIPGHNADFVNSSSVTHIISHELNDNDRIINGDQALIRKTTVIPQKIQDRNERSIDTHLNSIKVEGNVQGKTILLIDDVVTTGSSMMACKKLLLDAGAKVVYCYGFAIAHTHWPTSDIWKK